MGIRFLCHHCEKRLNVKQTQAGSEGMCPHCSETIHVPLKSTIPSAIEKRNHEARNSQRVKSIQGDDSIGLHDVDNQETMEGLAAEKRQISSGGKTTETLKRKQSESDAMLTFDSNDDSTELFMLAKPEPPETFGKIDPIAEAPSRIWYFRSHELGERGPLKGKSMQESLDRGEVTVGCVVWRDDWEDWFEAEKVFPKLVAEAKNQRKQAYVERALREANIEPKKKPSDKRKLLTKRRVFAATIGMGLVLILVLLLVLANVVSSN